MAKNSRGNDARQNLPDNLDNRHGFFVWRHPLTGSELPLGYITRREAIRQAREANHYLAALTPSPYPNHMRSPPLANGSPNTSNVSNSAAWRPIPCVPAAHRAKRYTR
ncbi:phage integrase Arm DNA-binding domain-containing protein [Edwardsiella tarda]|uniref:phage integrase Arm DNA-binding domain-containing protein n=1 Tax=Edwardsiella tarda TaxID=636 RepID=UPI00351BF28D